MREDIMLKEDVVETVCSEQGLDAVIIIANSEKSKTFNLDQATAIIGTPPRNVSGKKISLDGQQVTDLNIQIELSARVARICQRLR